MTYMDNVEVIVEKEKYTRDGVHKGMQGWVTEPENINGYWLVNFPQCGEKMILLQFLSGKKIWKWWKSLMHA